MNPDWKTIGWMAGISFGVFLIGTIVNNAVVDPFLEKQKLEAAHKAKSKKTAESPQA